MPIVATLYSDGYKELCELAINKKHISPVAFEQKLVAFLAAWDALPAHDATNTDTLKNKVQASRQQEINELLVYVAQCKSYSVEKSKLLFKAGASPDSVGYLSRKPAFIWAAERFDEGLVELFISHKVTIGLCWHHSGDALTIAARRSIKMVQMLLEAGARIESSEDDCERNALASAVNYNQPHIVEYLVSKGANINHQANVRSCAPIHFIACTHEGCKPHRTNNCHSKAPRIPEPGEFINCNVDMITLLARLGADLSLKCMARSEEAGILNIVHRPIQFCDDTRNTLCAMVQPLVVQRRLAFTMLLQKRLGDNVKVGALDAELVRMVVDNAESSCCLEDISLSSALFANILGPT